MFDTLLIAAKIIFYIIATIAIILILRFKYTAMKEDRHYELEQRKRDIEKIEQSRREKYATQYTFNNVTQLIVMANIPQPCKALFELSNTGYGFITLPALYSYIESIRVDKNIITGECNGRRKILNIKSCKCAITSCSRFNGKYIFERYSKGINNDANNIKVYEISEYWDESLVNYLARHPDIAISELRSMSKQTNFNLAADVISDLKKRLNKNIDEDTIAANFITNLSSITAFKRVVISSVSNIVGYTLNKEVAENEQRKIEHCEPRQVSSVQTESSDTISNEEKDQISPN